MKKLLFIDLEETIIRSWHDPTLCNVEFVKNIIREEKVEEIHIFSFAIFNQKDMDYFESNLKPFLETVLGVKILSWMSISELNKVIRRFTSVVLEDWELTDVWGKFRCFQDYCRAQFTNSDCILVDDVTPNSVFSLPDFNLVIRTIKAPVL